VDPLLSLSALELARRIRTGELSSAEVVERHIAHVLRVNPGLNAVVCDRFEAARAEAKEADRALAAADASPPGPLHGVPCTVKECFALAGMPWTGGVVARRDVVAREDAVAVARLRAAGAIPLGVTNVPEIGLWPETYNRVYGRTRNPYDPRRSAWGSSGGEGAIVGAGASPFGLGSDIGGSIRGPAFVCGVFGHKPSGGLVPGTGYFPEVTGEAQRFMVSGPLARRAEDLMPVLRVLAGPDGAWKCDPIELGDPAGVDLARLRVWVVEGSGGPFRVDPELLAAQRNAGEALRRRGAKVAVLRIPELRNAFEIWAARMLESGTPDVADLIGRGRPGELVAQLLRWTLGRSPHTLPTLLVGVAQRVGARLPGRPERFAALGHRLRRELDERLGDDAVLLYPPSRFTAPRHNRLLLHPFVFAWYGVWNVLELPVTQVPLGLGSRGLPLGVQVVAGFGRDHLSIAAALELERAFGGWLPPSALPLKG
jgi:fatty acid amide hydrolase 2